MDVDIFVFVFVVNLGDIILVIFVCTCTILYLIIASPVCFLISLFTCSLLLNFTFCLLLTQVTGESSPLERVEGPLRVLCGELYPEYDEMEVSWEGLGLDIVFNSDHSQNYKGFEAEVIISPLDEGKNFRTVLLEFDNSST